MSKFRSPNQICKILDILADISGLGAYFLKPIFALKPWVQAGRFEYHEPYIQNNYNHYQVSVLFRGFCYKQQNQTTETENSAQKNVHIFKSNAPTLLKLGVGLDHMYTKAWIFSSDKQLKK